MAVHQAVTGIKWDNVCSVPGIQLALNTSWPPPRPQSLAVAYALAPWDCKSSISYLLGIWQLAFLIFLLKQQQLWADTLRPTSPFSKIPVAVSSLSALFTLLNRVEEEQTRFDSWLSGISAKGGRRVRGLVSFWNGYGDFLNTDSKVAVLSGGSTGQ